MEDKIFIKVTNKMIFQKLEDIEKRCMNIEKHAIETNGKVKSNRWIATTAVTLVIIALGWCFKLAGGM